MSNASIMPHQSQTRRAGPMTLSHTLIANRKAAFGRVCDDNSSQRAAGCVAFLELTDQRLRLAVSFDPSARSTSIPSTVACPVNATCVAGSPDNAKRSPPIGTSVLTGPLPR